ncbi:LD-carboxypeptidase [Flavobacteriaceae bacterium]|jgi:muramoyltetrapeptide carboxypeptidase|nr:LD-carboxypeptidase [Flavobacteriaceae bacterium]MDA9631603.1 LD-carboxypeptidase [Bacteroidota bacterium]MDC0552440.1 LD-carboxypeptidase [Flavobacteriaceae bacterium]
MKIKIIYFTFIYISIISNMNVFSQSDIKSSNVLKTQLIQPEYLKYGDTISIVAPSGVLNNFDNKIIKAINIFESWGLNVVLGKHIYDKNGHFAGTDKNREKDFQKALDNKNIKAIWCARGGYGAVRIIDKLKFDSYLRNPKWIIGFSDITVIHNKLNLYNSESIHAMMITGFEEIDQNNNSLSKLKSVLFGDDLSYSIGPNKNNKIGKSEGNIVGGNLTLLQSTIGSKTELKTKDKILFIEEVGEYAYSIDRMLYSLKRAGYFDNCKGLIVGQISNVKKNTTDFGMSINELILEVLDEYDFPILFDFPAGHEKTNYPIILGRKIKLDVTKSKSKVVFYN